MPPQSASRPVAICMLKIPFTNAIVFSQNSSGPEHFSTGIARKGHSFQMIGFYVVSDSNSLTFFSAHFANICKFVAAFDPVLTFLHH